MMKSTRNVNKFLTLSPNEVENAAKEERDKWKKFRIQQVRAQANEEASKIRQRRRQEEVLLKSTLRQTLKVNWEKEQNEKLRKLNSEFENNLHDFGIAHRNANKERNDMKVHEEKIIHNSKLAKLRGAQARKYQDMKKNSEFEKENTLSYRRQRLKSQEKFRSQKIAKMPTPEKFKPKKTVTFKAPKKVILHEAGTYTSSSYVPPLTIVQREIVTDVTTAQEAAAHKNKEEENLEKMREQMEKEKKLKITERGKLALKKEKLKELQLHLIEELDKADLEHQLSDYLKEDSVDDSTDSTSDTVFCPKKCESKVKEILEKENVIREECITERLSFTNDVQSRIDKFFDRSLNNGTKNSISISLREETSFCPHQGGENATTQTSFGDSQDIHLKETVPVHKLPMLNEKFKSTNLTNEEENTDSSHTFSSGDHTETDNCVKSRRNLVTSYETEYYELPNSLMKKADEAKLREIKNINRDSVYKNISTSSTSSTDYMSIPESLPHQSRITESNEDIWKKLRQIQENSKKIKQYIGIKKIPVEPISSPDKKNSVEKDYHTFKTPPRLYSEEIKSDGSGERPLTRKEKFERCKKKVIELYIQRLIKMKPEEVSQLSVSSVDGSGFSLSSQGNLGDLLKLQSHLIEPCSTIISSSSSITPSYSIDPGTSHSDSKKSKIDEMDCIPVKIPSISEITHYSSASDSYAEASSTTAPDISSIKSVSSISSSNVSSDPNVFDLINKMIHQLEKLRPMVEDEKSQEASSDYSSYINYSKHEFTEINSRREGSSFEYSDPGSYQTPSREMEDSESSFMTSRSSLQVETTLSSCQHKQTHQNVLEGEQDLLKKYLETLRIAMQASNPNFDHKELEKTTSEDSNSSRTEVDNREKSNSPPQLEEGDKTSQEVMKSSDESHDSKSEEAKKSEEQITHESSSSTNSIPDMIPILERFGLSWAQGMIRKMDKAEENLSSSDSAL